MSDFPDTARLYPTDGLISTVGDHSVGGDYSVQGIGVFTGQAWLSANRAYFWPFALEDATTFDRIGIFNGGTVSGNFDVGVFDLAGNRKYHSGSTAQAGISGPQMITGIALALTPGYYTLGLSFDNTTATVFGNTNMGIGWAMAHGIQKMDTAFPLPDPVTYARADSGVMSNVFLVKRTVF